MLAALVSVGTSRLLLPSQRRGVGLELVPAKSEDCLRSGILGELFETSAEEVLVRGCREVMVDQAKVAALLAPGPFVSLAEVLDDREDFSGLPVRKVFRILCLSGLGDLSF